MSSMILKDLESRLGNCISIVDGKVIIQDERLLRKNIHVLAELSALDKGPIRDWARYLTRLLAIACHVIPSSIQELYVARGQGEVPSTFTIPAINLRALSYDAALAVFRAAKKLNATAFIFEIARSEMGYTDQRPVEYTTNVLVAAIEEGFYGPVFIQGDHFQVSQKRYSVDSEKEINAVKDLIKEAISAGFYNIDIDTSTLVDLNKTSVPDQQFLNINLSAMFTDYIRKIEPEGVTISVGGEIGEVGGHNSTEEELRAYMDGYNSELAKLSPGAKGLSKISVQTGTSHGGVVLPDGSIAQVSVDFNTLLHLSQVARNSYGLGGAVQHGASTLPEEAFGKFVESEACEVHLATNFQNMLFERLPEQLRIEMYAYLDEKFSEDRKSGMTDEQFYYKTRKNAIGPYKSALWNLPHEKKEEIRLAWEEQFYKLFVLLNIAGSNAYLDKTVKAIPTKPDVKTYLGESVSEKNISDLAD